MQNKLDSEFQDVNKNETPDNKNTTIEYLQKQLLAEQLYQQKKAQFACMRGEFKKKAD